MAVLHSVFSFVLFGGACLGHLALCVFGHNWWYGWHVSERISKLMRLVHHGLVVAFPVFLWSRVGFDPLAAYSSAGGGPVLRGLALYLPLCWAVGFLVFPAITLARRLRKTSPALLGNHTDRLDVAARLGYRPVGTSRHRLLAYFPYNQIFRVDFTEKTFRLPRLPAAWDGLTVLHLSDLHFVGTPDRVFYDQVMDACAAWEPDLVALTGDLVDTRRHARWIVPVLRRLRWRVAAFAILGNHDRWHDPPLLRRRLRRAGLHYLGNGWRQVEVRGEPLVVIGQEGPWFKPAPDLKGCPDGPFRLCLSHTPDNIGWARRQGVDLMLSGHNHGGQIRLPLFGSVFVPSRYSRRYDCGVFHEPPTLLHVNRGLAAKHPIRYNCPPEVTKIVLRK